MLINDFFNITSIEHGAVSATYNVELNGSHTIYKAHFPGNPVTPGVCILQMATEILEHHFGKGLAMSYAKRVRYKNMLLPWHKPAFTISKIKEDENKVNVCVAVEDGEQTFATMSLAFEWKI
ncbi:MAG: hypothetical protein HUK06_08210 [Bacteroidaceae bacterium]|nr:hypothetical protein [Bacteroidaceae bacterium]